MKGIVRILRISVIRRMFAETANICLQGRRLRSPSASGCKFIIIFLNKLLIDCTIFFVTMGFSFPQKSFVTFKMC